MANFNYLDFIKTPTSTDRVLSIKDKNNVVVYTLNPFKVDNVLVQNNNIRVNFTNSDYVLIDFNNNAESRIAIKVLETNLEILRNKVPYNIDKQTELYVNQLIGSISTINDNLTVWGDIIPGQNNVYNLGSPTHEWHSLHVGSSSIYLGGVTLSSHNDSLVVNSINLGTPNAPYVLSAKNDVLYYNGLTFSPGSNNFSSFTTLIAIDNAIINNASSFTLNYHATFPTNVQTLESFDNSQGFYLQTKIPAPVYSNSQIRLGAYGVENNYRITLYDDEISPYYYLGNNIDEYIDGIWENEFIFSIYSDGFNINYEINGVNVLTLTYSNDVYGYRAEPIYSLNSEYTFDNVLFYPTGKKGIVGDRYYATSTDLLTVPSHEEYVELTVQSDLAFSNGQWLLIKNDDIDIYSENYEGLVLSFYGVVENYDSMSGLLSMMALYPVGTGSTASFWYVNLSGKEGPQGIKGDADRYTATSSTILTIPTPNTALSITVSNNLAYTSGQTVIIYGDRPDFYSDPEYSEGGINHYFISSIDNYNSTTGELTLVVDYASGAGYTISNWYMNLTGQYYPPTSATNPATYGVVTSDGLTGLIVNSNLTFDGNLLKIEATTQLQQTIEVFNTATASSIITYDFNLGSIWHHSDLNSDYVANFINVPTEDKKVITTSIIINQNSPAYLPKVVSVNGYFCPINWVNGEEPVGNELNTDLIGLSLIHNEGFYVLGQLSTNTVTSAPTVATDDYDLNYGNFTIYWSIADIGDSNILQSGIVYATHSSPTILDSFTTDNQTGIGSYDTTVNGINPNISQNYYIKAYAINSYGIGYGNEISFNTYYLCLIEGTLVTLYNGGKKKIEDVTYDDELLVWNFDEAKFDSAKPIWMSQGSKSNGYNVIKFSDGSELKTILPHLGHRIFNIEKNKFTYPMTDETPIGTHTFNDKGEIVELISKETVDLGGKFYNIISDKHLNIFCNSILTSCRLNNLYEIKDMKFIKDNREIITIDNFDEITKQYYYGCRLGEQSTGIEELIEYIKNMHNIRK